MSGIETLKALTTQRPSLPVVVLSGLSDPQTESRALEEGAAEFVTKPVQLDDLLAVISRALIRSRGYGLWPDDQR